MALKFDLGEALSQAAHAAGEMAKGASATVESAAKGVANAAEGAGNAIVDTAASASEAIGSAMCSAAEGVSSASEQVALSDAGKAIAGGRERGGRNRRRRRNGFGPGSIVPRVRRGVDCRRRHQRHQGELVLRAPPQGAHQGLP